MFVATMAFFSPIVFLPVGSKCCRLERDAVRLSTSCTSRRPDHQRDGFGPDRGADRSLQGARACSPRHARRRAVPSFEPSGGHARSRPIHLDVRHRTWVSAHVLDLHPRGPGCGRASADWHRYDSLTFFQQLGGSVGLAVAGTVFGSRLVGGAAARAFRIGATASRRGLRERREQRVVGQLSGVGDLGQAILAAAPAAARAQLEPFVPAIVDAIHRASRSRPRARSRTGSRPQQWQSSWWRSCARRQLARRPRGMRRSRRRPLPFRAWGHFPLRIGLRYSRCWRTRSGSFRWGAIRRNRCSTIPST